MISCIAYLRGHEKNINNWRNQNGWNCPWIWYTVCGQRSYVYRQKSSMNNQPSICLCSIIWHWFERLEEDKNKLKVAKDVCNGITLTQIRMCICLKLIPFIASANQFFLKISLDLGESWKMRPSVRTLFSVLLENLIREIRIKTCRLFYKPI